MDILTHAGIGLIAAGPFVNSLPELALGIVAGSVVPDLDALARLFGKTAFVQCHQTWSHALLVQAIVSALAGCLAQHFGFDGMMLGIGLAGGMAFHTLLDFTNTLGVMLLVPFVMRRVCVEWVFFIDAFVLVTTLIAALITVVDFSTAGEVSVKVFLIYFAALILYVAAKAVLRRRAGRAAADAVSIIPSALYPWYFFAVVNARARVQLLKINAPSGAQSLISEHEILDSAYGCVAEVPEFALMRKLSPAYHVAKAEQTVEGELLLCRDFRTRNFGTTFGDLEVLLDSQQRVKRIHFHV